MKKIVVCVTALSVIGLIIFLSLYFGPGYVGKKSALLVIDMQNKVFPIFREKMISSNINRLAAAANKAGVPVIYIQQSSGEGIEKGSSGWQLHPSIKPVGEYLSLCKNHADAFADTELDSMLKRMGVETVVVTGAATDQCVNATIWGARNLGYRIVIATDAHSPCLGDSPESLIEYYNKYWDSEKSFTLLPSVRISF